MGTDKKDNDNNFEDEKDDNHDPNTEDINADHDDDDQGTDDAPGDDDDDQKLSPEERLGKALENTFKLAKVLDVLKDLFLKEG